MTILLLYYDIRFKGGDFLDSLITKLIEFENRFGKSIFSDKLKLMSLIKDYFPDNKREQSLIAKGIELNIYNRMENLSTNEIILLKNQLIKELYEEHGLNELSAEETVEIWIKLLEHIKKIKIPKGKIVQSPDKAIATKTHREASATYNKVKTNDKSTITDLDRATVAFEKKLTQTSQSKKQTSLTKTSLQKNSLPKSAPNPNIPSTPLKTAKVDADQNDNETVFNDALFHLIQGETEEAFTIFEDLAENDDPTAQSILASCYYNGNVVSKDYDQAFKWFERAAILGQSHSQNMLGFCYSHGLGTEKDYNEAIKWYKKSADQGEPQAQNNLGFCYFNGYGTAQNIDLALEYFGKASDQGEAAAQTSLGNCYYGGYGVPQDFATAVSLYKLAADQGNADAQLNLGECYLKGEGVERNVQIAIKYFEKSAEQNNNEAKLLLKEASSNATTHDLKINAFNSMDLYNNNERYAKKFARKILSQIENKSLLKKLFLYFVDEYNIERMNVAKNTYVKLEEFEYPLFLFDNNPFHTYLFTTRGIYIRTLLLKPRFIYYADVFTIDLGDKKSFKINNHTVNCLILSKEAVTELIELINTTIKEYK